ncbi:hypothetical protein B9Z55_021843 [Caenorhabditis nigoni]|uniref:ATP-dependent DNA helicase n=1 Tax=Caenorhabditis nigoni TaxID=1611254 RepID=A0A2G5TUA7_9PELO|nr:hypothetical protein B9Z55_021843 [Caenorhabditis nigoni]
MAPIFSRPIVLNADQERVFSRITTDVYKDNKVCMALILYVGGAAGTGKSVLIKQLTNHIGIQHVLLLGTTSMCAKSIGGGTVHSVLKLNIFTEEKDDEPIPPHPFLKLLIIDEISMCDAKLLRRIEKRMRQLMRNDLPFGGCTTVFFGDILQIPPVPEKGPDGHPTKIDYVFECKKTIFVQYNNSFSAPLWQNLVQYEELEIVMRQEEDPEFAERLKRWRVGEYNEDDNVFLNRKAMDWVFIDQDTITTNLCEQFKSEGNKMVLSFTNSAVFNYNKNITEKLFHPDHLYQISHSTYTIHKGVTSSTHVPRFTVGEGSRVLINKNSRGSRLVNGEICTVRNIKSIDNRVVSLDVTLDSTQETQELEPIKSELVLGSDTHSWKIEYQIQPAYALTYHKSQGQTLDAVFLDAGKNLQPAMFYVGASRVRCSDHLFVLNYNATDSISADPYALEEYKRLRMTIGLPPLPT